MNKEVIIDIENPKDNDLISRQEVLNLVNSDWKYEGLELDIENLPPVRPQEKTGYCKDCKYFEYDSVAKVDGIPLIVAHEICKRWGDGCKTKEDGYCFLFEPQESENEQGLSYVDQDTLMSAI